LFDATIVLSVALMVALLARPLMRVRSLEEKGITARTSQSPATPSLQAITRRGQKLERFRVSDQSVGGDGERIGIAYRLKTGEVICVTADSGGN
jgi:hypothetical protein